LSDAEKIKDLMKARNLSQNAFAKETGVAQSYISYIINGKQQITERIAKKICSALDIDMSYFEREEMVEEQPINETVITFPKEEDKNTISIDDAALYGDILDIAIKITELRSQLLEKIKVDREKDKYYNGIDQDFLHHVENLDKLSDKEAIDIILKEKESRKNRRTVKNRVFFVQGMLNALPNPNLYQFVINGINRNKNYEYKPRNELSTNAIKGDM
jgi:transcriptional regulator with XRE-family HTH domain